jgi:hypothetical protein
MKKFRCEKRSFTVACLLAALASLLLLSLFTFDSAAQQKDKTMTDIKLMTLDPGHFHAALVQKEMLTGVSPQVHVYAPLGFDLTEHLKRITGFNTRKENPARWELENPHQAPTTLHGCCVRNQATSSSSPGAIKARLTVSKPASKTA